MWKHIWVYNKKHFVLIWEIGAQFLDIPELLPLAKKERLGGE